MSISVEARTRATSAQIWKLWTDVEGSPLWDTDVEWSRLHGRFAVGTEGEFKLKTGQHARFTLVEVSPEVSYSNVVRMPGFRVCFTHRLERVSPRELRVVHGAQITGPLAWPVRALARKPLTQALSAALTNMLRLAERETFDAAA